MATLAHRGGRTSSQNNHSKVIWPGDICVGVIRSLRAYINRGNEGRHRMVHERIQEGPARPKDPLKTVIYGGQEAHAGTKKC
jgi:hypothetical protein